MAIPVTAVFDIGKTNKKFLLFDNTYTVVQQQQTTLEQIKDDDGDSCENLASLELWIHEKLRQTLQDNEYYIECVNYSTYGASLVHLDKDGEVVTPLYNYQKPYPDELLERFYKSNGGRESFALETASPPMGMLNSGLQLYWLQKKNPCILKK